MITPKQVIRKYMQVFGRKLSIPRECSWFENNNVNECEEDSCYCNQFTRPFEVRITKLV